MLDEKTGKQIAQRWLDAWNSHDLDEILSHYGEEVQFFSPLITKLLKDPSGKIQGKPALRAYFAQGLMAYPDLKFEPIQVLTGVNSVVIYYRSVQNLYSAEFMVIGDQNLITHVQAHYSSSV
ncbi:MAG TPA: nuclear transport factor 2 family protein [Coleofasciculaceae cyanobacterium]|jgi:hypothetical protein